MEKYGKKEEQNIFQWNNVKNRKNRKIEKSGKPKNRKTEKPKNRKTEKPEKI